MMATVPAGLRIRAYEPHDFDDVWRLHREGVTRTRDEYVEVMKGGYEADLHAIEETYLTGGAFWVVEADDGALIGMTAVQPIDEKTGRLRRMRVTPEYRGRGIGQALVDTAAEFCRERGYTKLILDTTEQQVEGQRLYERNGFVKTGERMLGTFRVFDYERRLG
jgi:ribosomal protein S18 acetylase RimI-like enzyme